MRYSLAACGILVMSVSALHAAETESTWEPNYLETARSYCAPQIEMLLEAEEQGPKLLADAKIEWDPALPENQHRAFNKFGAWAIVGSVQVAQLTTYMVAINESKPVSEQLVNANWALLELSDCLWLSQEERDLIEELMLSTPMDEAGEGPSYSSEDVDVVLGPLDQAECFRWREASGRILEISPESEGAKTRMHEILVDTVGQCEEKFEMPFERNF
ncbi:hypothetical protein [Ruegeria sp. MALMAid1280]|uniref:hypothetical protein n=1 Tax=Ruegeria sp. MALMAid1280 TaxID=3411634 RepID=UPI003BA2200E